MKRWLIIALAVALLAGLGTWTLARKLAPAPASAAAFDPEQARLAIRFLDLLDAAEYEAALAMATPRLQQGLAGGKLQQAWEGVPATFGKRESRGEPRCETIDGQPLVSSRLQFAMLAFDARVVFDANNVISGFWIVPASKPSTATAKTADAARRERELSVGEEPLALPATLTLPMGDGPFPAVVLVHGSGPHDRDETIGPNKPFLDLAHGLADQGIAVLRYEKRTRVHPEAFAGNTFTVDDETVDDALAAVALLRTQQDIDSRNIFVAGHSLGAMMAPRIGERDPAIAGLILLAAPASKLEDIVVRQTRYLARLQGMGNAEIAKALDAIEPQREAVRQMAADAAAGTPLLLGLPASYWRDLNGYDPIVTAGLVKQPMLILQGGRDYQVTVADEFSAWRAAFATNPRFEMIEYPSLGHAFMTGNDPPGPKDAESPAHVDHKVLDDIARWVKGNRPPAT
ncbi:MAG TPA: alpha/beta fold hydrolase [Dokdonella sp.]|nr:alpha/beta fold hydrolase [Dokdonella sp.]